MKDLLGISLGHRDIVARRTAQGWRISRVVLIGYSNPSKVQPLAVCVDFEAYGAGSSWHEVTDSSSLQRIAVGAELRVSTEDLIKRIPDLSKALDDFELHELNFQLAQA